MPRGGGRAPKKNYKGKSRHFTDEETLKAQLEKEKREKEWRRERGEEEEEEEEGAEGAKAEKSGSGSSSEDSSDEEVKAKGVSHLIEIENPNRVQRKTKKIGAAEADTGPQLSRREREELEKQQAKERYNKLHMEGKTEEARADLARLALIRQQRADAAKKREAERLGTS